MCVWLQKPEAPEPEAPEPGSEVKSKVSCRASVEKSGRPPAPCETRPIESATAACHGEAGVPAPPVGLIAAAGS